MENQKEELYEKTIKEINFLGEELVDALQTIVQRNEDTLKNHNYKELHSIISYYNEQQKIMLEMCKNIVILCKNASF